MVGRCLWAALIIVSTIGVVAGSSWPLLRLSERLHEKIGHAKPKQKAHSRWGGDRGHRPLELRRTSSSDTHNDDPELQDLQVASQSSEEKDGNNNNNADHDIPHNKNTRREPLSVATHTPKDVVKMSRSPSLDEADVRPHGQHWSQQGSRKLSIAKAVAKRVPGQESLAHRRTQSDELSSENEVRRLLANKHTSDENHQERNSPVEASFSERHGVHQDQQGPHATHVARRVSRNAPSMETSELGVPSEAPSARQHAADEKPPRSHIKGNREHNTNRARHVTVGVATPSEAPPLKKHAVHETSNKSSINGKRQTNTILSKRGRELEIGETKAIEATLQEAPLTETPSVEHQLAESLQAGWQLVGPVRDSLNMWPAEAPLESPVATQNETAVKLMVATSQKIPPLDTHKPNESSPEAPSQDKRRESFVVVTDPRSGSEWFMELLDRHPKICSSGEATEGREGYPRESLIPARYLPAKANPVSLLGLRKTTGNLCRVHGNTACNWALMSSVVWKVLNDPQLCAGTEEEWTTTAEEAGLGDHMTLVCKLCQDSLMQVVANSNMSDATPKNIAAEAFRRFLHLQLNSSLHLEDGEFLKKAKEGSVLPCRCPQSAVTTGQKLMHEWIGDLPLTGAAAQGWKERPYSVNFNALQASEALETPYYDIIGSLKELGSRAIVLLRKNQLARYVSLQTANTNGLFHCNTEEDVQKASSTAVKVDIADFTHFMAWNTEIQKNVHGKLKSAGIPLMFVFYEDCVENTLGCLEKVASFLKVDAPGPELLQETTLRKGSQSLREHIANIDEVLHMLQEDGREHWLD